MVGFCAEHKIETGYVITREMTDFQVLEIEREGAKARLLKSTLHSRAIGSGAQNSNPRVKASHEPQGASGLTSQLSTLDF